VIGLRHDFCRTTLEIGAGCSRDIPVCARTRNRKLPRTTVPEREGDTDRVLAAFQS